MKKLLFVAALSAAAATDVGLHISRAEAGCGAVVAQPKSDGLSVPYVAPKVGDKATVVDEMSVTGTVAQGGKSMPMEEGAKETYTQEVLAADTDTVTKLKLTFTAAHATANMGGQKKSLDLAVKGKAYVLSWEGGRVVYKSDAGADATKDELDVLTKLSSNVGQPDRMGKLLGGKSFKKGEKVVLTDEDMKAIAAPNQDMAAKDVSITLTKSDKKTATFAFAGTFSGSQGGMDISIKMTGSIKVDLAKSRPLDFTMTGDMSGSGAATFKGKITAHKTMSYK